LLHFFLTRSYFYDALLINDVELNQVYHNKEISMKKFMLFVFTFLFLPSLVNAVSRWEREYELDNGTRIARKPDGIHMRSRNADIFGGRGIFWNGTNLSIDMEEPAFRREVSKLGRIRTKPNRLGGTPAGVVKKRSTPSVKKRPAAVVKKRPVVPSVNKRPATVVKKRPVVPAVNKRPATVVRKRPAVPVVNKRPATVVKKRPVVPAVNKRPATVVRKRPVVPVVNKRPATVVRKRPAVPVVNKRPATVVKNRLAARAVPKRQVPRMGIRSTRRR
jgi:hypothetical protein